MLTLKKRERGEVRRSENVDRNKIWLVRWLSKMKKAWGVCKALSLSWMQKPAHSWQARGRLASWLKSLHLNNNLTHVYCNNSWIHLLIQTTDLLFIYSPLFLQVMPTHSSTSSTSPLQWWLVPWLEHLERTANSWSDIFTSRARASEDFGPVFSSCCFSFSSIRKI